MENKQQNLKVSQLLNDFEIIKKIGDGSFSQVYKVRRYSDNKYYALKKVRLGKLSFKEKENALNEVRILASIENDFIVSYKEAFYDDYSSSLCLVMELLEGGSLQELIDKNKKTKTNLPEQQAWSYIVQMCLGLKVLHDKNILHRDIKCANVFMDSSKEIAKIGDMNVSKENKKGYLMTQTGTPYYASPEIWQDQPYDSKSDIWSLGCVVYELLTYNPPFMANDMNGLYNKIQKGVYKKISKQYSADLDEFIDKCLQKNTSKRASIDDLLAMSAVQNHLGDVVTNRNEGLGLLQTIKVPKSITILKKILPKSKYEAENKENDNLGHNRESLPLIINQSYNQYNKVQKRQDSLENQMKTPVINNKYYYNVSNRNSSLQKKKLF